MPKKPLKRLKNGETKLSLISERIKRLRDRAKIMQETKGTTDIVKDFNDAADLIEEISAKLSSWNLGEEMVVDCNECRNRSRRKICKICHDGDCYEEMANTNADRIRKMDDEELAKFIGAVKCNTYMIECGYPACSGMDGSSCVETDRKADSDILEWLRLSNSRV